MYKQIILVFLLFIFSLPSSAYVGPGMGGGIIAATIGVVFAIFLAIFGILWFPIKRFLKKRRSAKQEKKQN